MSDYTSADIARAIGMGPEEKPEWWEWFPTYGCTCFTGPDFLHDDGVCITYVWPWLAERGCQCWMPQKRTWIHMPERELDGEDAADVVKADSFSAACCDAVMRMKEEA